MQKIFLDKQLEKLLVFTLEDVQELIVKLDNRRQNGFISHTRILMEGSNFNLVCNTS